MNAKLPITLLYVEDETAIREAVATFLRLGCDTVITAADGREALARCREQQPDVVVTDILMPGMDGLELAARLKDGHPQLPVIITTAFSDTEHLLRAIELGIRSFIRKPLDYYDLMASIRSATLPSIQQREIEKLRAQRSNSFFPGSGSRMAAVAEQVEQVAEGDYRVLIHGEKGSGKTRCARVIHAMSRRSKRPFIAVNCRGMNGEQLDLELFGKERGAVGRVSAAAGGTLFLHDLDTAPLQTQAKLLRFMEEGCYLPAGGKIVVFGDVRIIASVLGDARQAVAGGRLLEGLFYHMADALLRMPALREMPEEIPVLARLFLADGAADTGRATPQLSEEASRLLKTMEWEGNVRKLKNLMRRAVLQADRVVTPATLQPLLRADAATPLATPAAPPPSLSLEAVERWAIGRALAASNGRKLKAAAMLGIDYKRLQRKMTRYGIS